MDSRERTLEKLSYAVIDVETTGVFPTSDRVIEIAVVRIDVDGNVKSRYTTLVNPTRDVGAIGLHGIEPRMVLHAPTFAEVAGDRLSYLTDAVWVAPSLSFTIRFLRAEYDRLGYELPKVPASCISVLGEKYSVENSVRRLAWACRAEGIRHDKGYSALRDVEATAQLLCIYLGRARAEGVETLEDLAPTVAGADEPFLQLVPRAFCTGAPTLERGEADAVVAESRRDFISDLIGRLSPAAALGTVGDEGTNLYLDLLDRVLLDRRIDEDERDQMVRLAGEWNLSAQAALQAHESYLRRLVDSPLGASGTSRSGASGASRRG